MLTQYTYIKPRYQFGKQCIFTVHQHVAEEDILPEPELMQNYVTRSHFHRETQLATQYAAHEVQTTRKIIANSGMLHSEGGWPREVNPRDSEAVQRYRRRVEKDDQWPISMRTLLPSMERCVLQNNAMNIYQNYFDDLVPTSMVKQHDIRITNLYEDPEVKPRPIRHLSWSPSDSNRLVAAYGFLEFEEHSADVSPYSYVWDIENPNKALYTLKSTSPLLTVEFNSRDPVLLISGLASGQVCCWDIRMSEKPMQTSHPYISHRHPAIQALWIPSKANTDFFSASTDGMVLWWDIRFLKKPTAALLMDLDDPVRGSPLNAVGITALQFEPTISSKFLAGTENGLVVNVNRRTNNPVEKLAIRFECYTGPVIAIDRNPIYTKAFLTIGDWSAKVWADDTKEGNLFSTSDKDIDLSGGCWSQSRGSVFFVINVDGMLEAYDILAGVKTPLTAIRVCRDSLTAIKAHEDGEYLAVGSRNGNVYLLECSQDLASFTKEDKIALSNRLERSSRFERAIDNRMKEIRVMHGSMSDFRGIGLKQDAKSKAKKKEPKEKKRLSKVAPVDKERRDSRMKSRVTRPKMKSSVKMSFPHLDDAEIHYFNKVEELEATYVDLDPEDFEAAQALLKERTAPPPEEEETEPEKEDLKKRRSVRKIKSRTRTIRSARKSREKLEEERGDEVDLDSVKRRDTKSRGRRALKKSCPPTVVCKPEVCCRDMEGKRRAKWLRKKQDKDTEREDIEKLPVRSRSFVVDNKWFRRLTDYIVQIPQPSRAFRRKIMAAKNTPPNVLRKELQEAKREVRAWQEKAIARQLGFWTVDKKLKGEEEAAEALKMVESKGESLMLEESERRLSDAKRDSSRQITLVRVDAPPVKKQRGKKGKKVKARQEEIEDEQEEQQRQLWQKLKQKVKQYDVQQRKHQKQFYPRISAAFVRISDDDLDAPTTDERRDSKKH